MKRISKATKLVFLRHLLWGVPLAAFLHSILQFAYEPFFEPVDLLIFFLHFFLGIVIGAVILIPAYFLQALLYLFLQRRGVRCSALIFICGVFQALLVALWAAVVGIEPSLAGRFLLTPPMIFAGFLAGAAVAGITCRKEGRVL